MINDHTDRELDALLARADRAVLDAVTEGLDIARGLTQFPGLASGQSTTAEESQASSRVRSESALDVSAQLDSLLESTAGMLKTLNRLRTPISASGYYGTPDDPSSLRRCLDEATAALTTLRQGLEARRLSKTEGIALVNRAIGMSGNIGIALVGVASSTEEEAEYWQALEWIDTIDEVHDRLRDLARTIPRLFDDATDTVTNPVPLR